ncbi:hypothetical protein BDA96_10G027000 [Sorghum bicolor]|jgi:hypothetical protein|uniref:Uncharacterized protein 131L1.10b n=2 Tax=Sorghum bicolor TaxID=4558 RepID=Q5NKS1_SORBI|nr:uncharacterized protein LOC8069072 [Sorghum bicolor]AAQ06266.1 unknown [Sorghum bicolor]EER89128.1 hypothetical protein SORBI_3010G023300 [Sorghum bicolor]KAG0512583.1 hypothetical protein BDA96_10G027000 [Sorghum bicolor]|eukprot:XP_002437761.1 uncharacterized protein LOC8069072 [Sorghum bicolor]
MDKVLAFSILSASPADISAGAGSGGSWARLSWRRCADDQQAAAAAVAGRQREEQEEDKDKRGSCSRSRGGGRAAPAAAPRFAPEFDGIDCFETIVSH